MRLFGRVVKPDAEGISRAVENDAYFMHERTNLLMVNRLWPTQIRLHTIAGNQTDLDASGVLSSALAIAKYRGGGIRCHGLSAHR